VPFSGKNSGPSPMPSRRRSRNSRAAPRIGVTRDFLFFERPAGSVQIHFSRSSSAPPSPQISPTLAPSSSSSADHLPALFGFAHAAPIGDGVQELTNVTP
jgi:hypothetical protein